MKLNTKALAVSALVLFNEQLNDDNHFYPNYRTYVGLYYDPTVDNIGVRLYFEKPKKYYKLLGNYISIGCVDSTETVEYNILEQLHRDYCNCLSSRSKTRDWEYSMFDNSYYKSGMTYFKYRSFEIWIDEGDNVIKMKDKRVYGDVGCRMYANEKFSMKLALGDIRKSLDKKCSYSESEWSRYADKIFKIVDTWEPDKIASTFGKNGLDFKKIEKYEKEGII